LKINNTEKFKWLDKTTTACNVLSHCLKSLATLYRKVVTASAKTFITDVIPRTRYRFPNRRVEFHSRMWILF